MSPNVWRGYEGPTYLFMVGQRRRNLSKCLSYPAVEWTGSGVVVSFSFLWVCKQRLGALFINILRGIIIKLDGYCSCFQLRRSMIL